MNKTFDLKTKSLQEKIEDQSLKMAQFWSLTIFVALGVIAIITELSK